MRHTLPLIVLLLIGVQSAVQAHPGEVVKGFQAPYSRSTGLTFDGQLRQVVPHGHTDPIRHGPPARGWSEKAQRREVQGAG